MTDEIDARKELTRRISEGSPDIAELTALVLINEVLPALDNISTMLADVREKVAKSKSSALMALRWHRSMRSTNICKIWSHYRRQDRSHGSDKLLQEQLQRVIKKAEERQ